MSDAFRASLIEIVESKPILYDKSSPGYKDVAQKQEAWNSVTATLHALGYECNCADVQNEWLRIRERYTRERKKFGEPDSGPTWDMMPHLEFLERVVKYRRNRIIRKRSLPVEAVLSMSPKFILPKLNIKGNCMLEEEQSPCINESPSPECDVTILHTEMDSTPPSFIKTPKLSVPATSRQATSGSFGTKQRDGDALKETLNSYLNVVAEMSQNINTFLNDRPVKNSSNFTSSRDPDEESLRGFIMGFLPFWKALDLKDRAVLMSNVTALFADALHKSDSSQ